MLLVMNSIFRVQELLTLWVNLFDSYLAIFSQFMYLVYFELHSSFLG
jgi:hypothetical protein